MRHHLERVCQRLEGECLPPACRLAHNALRWSRTRQLLKASAEEEGRRLKRESELEVALASTVQERDQLASKLAMQVNAQLNFYFLSFQPKSHRLTMKE